MREKKSQLKEPGSPEPVPEPKPARRTHLASLSQEYRHDRSNQRWEVGAWTVEDSDPELSEEHGSVETESYGFGPARVFRQSSA